MKDKYIWYEKDRGADEGHAAKKIVAGKIMKATARAVVSES